MRSMDFLDVITIYSDLLDLWHTHFKGTRWPVLVLDEAHLLMDWSKDHPGELKALLGFLVKIRCLHDMCACPSRLLGLVPPTKP